MDTKKYNILVTRPEHQAETLCHLIENQGWNAIRFPTLQIVGIDTQVIRQQLDALEQYQWLIFISANAVNFALKANDGKIEPFNYCTIAAVGKSTKKALLSYNISVDLVPQNHFNTEGLLASTEMHNVQGKSCLIIRGKGGRETLANCLRERGAKVKYMEVYARIKPCHNDNIAQELIEQGKLHAITITSCEALLNLISMFNDEFYCMLRAVPLIIISNRIKELAVKHGFTQIAVSDFPSDSAIVKTVMKSLETQQ